jgi:hypothetical protein
VYLKEVVVMEERSIVLQFSLLSFLHLVLPLLLQLCYTLMDGKKNSVIHTYTHTEREKQTIIATCVPAAGAPWRWSS